MGGRFRNAGVFNGDLSAWDVSSVTSMRAMFTMTENFDTTQAFNSDISKWDVSSVTDMRYMFSHAYSFNRDISKWDVSSVTNMDHMFDHAESFRQTLCGDAWINSKATQDRMFDGSSGSISEAVCTAASTPDTTKGPLDHPSPPPSPERELIARTPSALTMTCPRCGTFTKSGRRSCCAPGGAWFTNCGDTHKKNVGHRWFDGVATCKRKFRTIGLLSVH